MNSLNFHYDPTTDVVTIEGIKYSAEFFRQFGSFMPLDTPLKITSREGGILHLVQMEPGDPDWQQPEKIVVARSIEVAK